LGMCALLTYQYFDYLTRFIGMLLSKLHFQTIATGSEAIPSAVPAIYVCTHTAWNDTLLILGAQRHRIRFFIEQEQEHHRWMKKLYRMLRVVLIPSIEPLENNTECLAQIRKTLARGISVCIFVENEDLHQAIEKLNRSYSFQELQETSSYPIIPVTIEKGEKHPPRRSWARSFLKKFRVPAAISFG